MMINLPFRSRHKFNSSSEFNFLKNIGEGAFSKVCLVQHKITRTNYAIKVIDLTKIPKLDHENVEKELAIQMGLNHNNLVYLHDFFIEETYVFYILEYCGKGNLFRYLNTKITINRDEIRDIFYKICQGIKYLHDKDIIMRDIKPENVVLNEDMTPKLCDFGWASSLSDKRYCSIRAGTFVYMSPESLLSKLQCKKSDVWCLGILLYELHFNKEPFNEISTEKQITKIKRKDYKMDTGKISIEAERLIRSILVFEPEKRPSIDEVLKSSYFKVFNRESLFISESKKREKKSCLKIGINDVPNIYSKKNDLNKLTKKQECNKEQERQTNTDSVRKESESHIKNANNNIDSNWIRNNFQQYMQNSNTKQKQTPTKERTLRRDVKKLVQYTRSISKQPKVNNTIKIPRKETGINIEKIITNDNLDKGVLKKPKKSVTSIRTYKTTKTKNIVLNLMDKINQGARREINTVKDMSQTNSQFNNTYHNFEYQPDLKKKREPTPGFEMTERGSKTSISIVSTNQTENFHNMNRKTKRDIPLSINIKDYGNYNKRSFSYSNPIHNDDKNRKIASGINKANFNTNVGHKFKPIMKTNVYGNMNQFQNQIDTTKYNTQRIVNPIMCKKIVPNIVYQNINQENNSQAINQQTNFYKNYQPIKKIKPKKSELDNQYISRKGIGNQINKPRTISNRYVKPQVIPSGVYKRRAEGIQNNGMFFMKSFKN